MRRRFGIPLSIALLMLVYMAQAYSPVEPYYVMAGVLALWAVIDSIRLKVTQHTSSQLATPVGLIVWMALAWPIALPWYLKVRYLVANGESLDKVGGTLGIRLAFYGIFVLVVAGGVVAFKFFPQLKNMLLFSRQVGEQFGGSVNVSANNTGQLVLTMSQERPADSAANARFARRVAMFARTHYDGADSLKTIEVVLQQAKSDGAVTVTRSNGRYKYTIAELSGAPAPAEVASTPPSRPGRGPRGAAVQPNVATVTPAGAPTGSASTRMSAASSPSTPSRRPVATHAFARLADADPGVSWVADSAIIADIDCDHAADTVVVGRKRGEVHVGFALAANPVPQILIFDVGRGAKNAVCGVRAALSLESLDWDPAERGLDQLAGFRRSPTCKGVGLGDGDCRTSHMFWSYSSRHVEWYQR
jgi:hypothetical protein